MNNYIVVDDLVSKIKQKTIELEILRRSVIEWQYSANGGLFTHLAYDANGNEEPLKSDFYSLFSEFTYAITKKFNVEVQKLIRMSVVLTMPDPANSSSLINSNSDVVGKTVVYYINDCDGDTILSEKTTAARIMPKKGRAVMFDTSIHHEESKSSVGPKAILKINFI